jgi:CubicO group peptidase (beta-lactamase class C family)
MSLVEEGKIRLNDPVSRFIPEFAKLDKVAVPKPGGAEGEFELVAASRPITIRDLLTHGSGLMSSGLGQRAAGQSVQRAPGDTLAVYVPKLAAVPLDFQPGTLWRYSGLAGFDVLSRVCEVVSRKPYDVFLKERIFTPLGMPDTGFSFTGRQSERVATIYTRRAGGNLEPNPQQTLDAVYFSGAGGLATTAEDYLQLAQMLLNGGELDGKRVLKRETVALMLQNHVPESWVPLHIADGWEIGRSGFGYGGAVRMDSDPAVAAPAGTFRWAGYGTTFFWIDPKNNLTGMVWTQYVPVMEHWIIDGEFQRLVYAALTPQPTGSR